jgi:RNA polymerase sigma-70 factor (ECF subfamily)
VADVCQNVFVSVFRDLPRFRWDEPGQSFQGWLRTITRHAVADWFRQRQRQPEAAGSAVDQLSASEQDESDTQDSQREDRQLLLARAAEVVQFDVEAGTWDMFRQTELEGRPPREVAGERGVSVWTVYKARQRIVCRLREVLDDWLTDLAPI